MNDIFKNKRVPVNTNKTNPAPTAPVPVASNATGTKQNNASTQSKSNNGFEVRGDENEIMSIHTNKNFVKVKSDTLSIKRFHLSFVEHDNSYKLLDNIEMYLDFKSASLLVSEFNRNVFDQKIVASLNEAKANNSNFPKPVFKSNMGGVNEAKANRSDGKAISRYFDISAGNKYPFVICAYEFKAHTDNKSGIIIPEGKPEKTIRIPVSYDDFNYFVKELENYMIAYATVRTQYIINKK